MGDTYKVRTNTSVHNKTYFQLLFALLFHLLKLLSRLMVRYKCFGGVQNNTAFITAITDASSRLRQRRRRDQRSTVAQMETNLLFVTRTSKRISFVPKENRLVVKVFHSPPPPQSPQTHFRAHSETIVSDLLLALQSPRFTF